MKAITRSDREKMGGTILDFILDSIERKRLATSDILKTPEPYSRKQIQKGLYHLKYKKFIAFPAHMPKARLLLTKLGIRRLNKRKFERINVKPTKWDGKWRLLTFDIPETQAQIRHIFRRKLKELGFFHFQRSVFIFPYPCAKELDFITDYLKISVDVHILTAERFPGDGPVAKKYGL